MVFMSEKKLIDRLPKNTERRGPGEYIPQSQIKKYKTDKEPFMSTVNGTLHKNNNVPGPGSYYRDEILIKYLKNNQNAKIIQKIKSNQNDEKLGFNTKEKRFDFLKKSNEPGPGYYFKITKNFKKKIKNNIHKNEFKKNDDLLQLIPTIPSKYQKYGFDILEDGKIVQKKDPHLSQTFTGEKGDSVGPGRYEISDEINWYKTGPHWSKEVRNCFISNNKYNLSGIFESTDQTDHSNHNNMSSSNFLSSITASKFVIDNNLNVIEITPCTISDINNNNINLDQYKLENDKNKKQKDYRLLINNVEKYKRILFRGTCQKFSNPGPGFYIDRFKNSSFQTKYVPENQQFFGSKTRRFTRNENKSSIENYKNSDFDLYSTNNNFYNENKNSNSELNHKFSKTKSLMNLAPFSTNEKRFIKFMDKDKDNNPSPFDYNIKSFLDGKKKSLSPQYFGHSEKKFTQKKEVKWKYSIPGPGVYDPEKPKKHVPTRKFFSDTFIDNNSLYNMKNEKEGIDVYSIKFQNEKKLKSTNNKNVCFYRTNFSNKNILRKSFSCERLNNKNKTIYSEFDENKIEYKQVYPPFHVSGFKDDSWLFAPNYCQGPGQYKKDSYFDWNKKTYNKNFL